MNEKLSPLEREIIEAILKCQKDIQVCEQLYKQYKVASVKKRIFTGVGFYTEFIINEKNLAIESNVQMQLGSVYATIEGLECGAGFVLFVENGFIATLEGYSYDEQWPNDAKVGEIFMVKDDGSLERTELT